MAGNTLSPKKHRNGEIPRLFVKRFPHGFLMENTGGLHNDLCIPHALYAVMIAQINIMAKQMGIVAPKISLQHLIELFGAVGKKDNNGAEMLVKLQTEGVVAEIHFGRRRDPDVKKYFISDSVEADYGISPENDDLEETIVDIKRELAYKPLFGVIDIHRNYAEEDYNVLYRPNGEKLRSHGGGFEAHYICLTGYGRSTEQGEEEKNVGEFLDSGGIHNGRNGGFKLLTSNSDCAYLLRE